MSRILTLNIGAAKAVLAEYSLSGKRNLTLTAYGTGDLPTVDVNDPSSIEVSLPPVLSQIMRESGIKAAPLVVSLCGQMVFPRFAKLPLTNDAEKTAQMVRYEVEQNVPFPIDEIVSDYQLLGTTPEGEQAAMVVAAKLEGVRAVTSAVAQAGLKPVFVDVAPMAILNALKFAYPNLSGCNVVLDIGSKTTNLIIIENEKIYNRSIPVAGNTITKELAQAFGCSFEEAEQLKIERGYVSLGGVTEDADEISDRVSKVIRSVLTRLHAEISRSINFYRSQQGGNAPSRLFLTGGTVRLPQLDQFFMESLQVDVEFLNPFGVVGVGSKVDQSALEGDAFTLAESVGLALRQTDAAAIRINLMPPELVAAARNIKRIPFLVVGGVCVLAALGAGIFAQKREAEVAQAKLECIEASNGGLRTLDTRLKACLKQEQEACQKSDEFQRLLWSRSDALRRIRAVRECLLPGMWITEWAALPPREGEELEGAKVTIRGWRDAMAKAQKDWSASNGGKLSTAATIVEGKLKGRPVFVPESVKIVAQKDVKESLVEFAIQMSFAPPPSVASETGRKGKAAKK